VGKISIARKKGPDGYIPDKKQASQMKGKDNPYYRDKFSYDPLKDEFTCLDGGILTCKSKYLTKARVNISICIMVHIVKVAQLNYNAPAEKAG